MKDLLCKIFERKHSRYLYIYKVEKGFLNIIQKPQNIKEKVDQLEYIKFLTLQLETINK